MSWPFKDYDYYGDRFVNIEDPHSELGEKMWYRQIPKLRTPFFTSGKFD